jgi:hypothetical protein
MHEHIGVDLNGITDTVAHCTDVLISTIDAQPTPIPACVIAPYFQGERPLGGFAAFESLHGRNWDAEHQQARHPIIKLLQQLENQSETVEAAATHGYRVGDLVASHLLAVSQRAHGHRIITVPDTLTELGQQQLLDGLRRLCVRAELLWRPVAVLLGWALAQKRLAERHGTTAMVIHAGVWRTEVSVLSLEVEEDTGVPFLIPVRHGKGQEVLPATWSVERLAQDILAVDLKNTGLPPALAEAQLWINRRPWSMLCGIPAPDEIVRDQLGHWHALAGQPKLSPQLGKAVWEPFLPIIAHSMSEHRIQAVLIEGPLVGLTLENGTLGERLAAEVRSYGRHQDCTVQVASIGAGLAAKGAAHYGWRRKNGIVGYYDTIPDLKINALVELRPNFISLMKGRDRVVGGETIGMEVEGFSIAEGTPAVDYYLTRADEPTVRETHTVLPEPAKRSMPVTLVVAQTPGQGFASVEIRPPIGERLGDRPVFLDWSSMKDTGETSEQVLARLRKEHGMAFPDPAPLPCHAAVWNATGVVPAMRDFLDKIDSGGAEKERVAKQLMSVLSKKQSLDWLLLSRSGGGRKAGIFDSDGKIPPRHELRQHVGDPPPGFATYQELVDRVLKATAFAFEKYMLRARNGDTDLHRHLLLIGGWSYAAAPEPILAYVRRSLEYGDTIHKRFDFNLAGRSFFKKEDITLLFRSVANHFNRRGLNRPFDRIKALSLVLSYRPDAPEALDSKLAYNLVEVAAALLAIETQQCNIKKKFFSAAYLLMGLLRYRRVDPAFMDREKPESAKLFEQVTTTLNAAERCVTGPTNDSVRTILKELTAFMEKRGTDALIFSKLDALSD